MFTDLLRRYRAAAIRCAWALITLLIFRPSAWAQPAAGPTGAGDQYWASNFVPPGLNGAVTALVEGPAGELYAGGDFTIAGSTLASKVARWDGTRWRPLGSGLTSSGGVLALAVAPNGDLYVGGSFTNAGTVFALGLARWNGTSWSTVGGNLGGVNSLDFPVVRALAFAPNGDLYVGGGFRTAGNGGTPVSAVNVARWNGSAWSALGTGTNDAVFALAFAPNGDLYAGGAFSRAGSVLSDQVARWNGSAWSSLAGAGSSGVVTALAATAGGDLYAGGTFTQMGAVAATGVARWRNGSWSALGTGAMVGRVNQLLVQGPTQVYIGGPFTSVSGVSAPGVALWNGQSWSAVGGGTNGEAKALLRSATTGQLYVGGAFSQAGTSRVAANIAGWDGSSWQTLGPQPADAPAGPVRAVVRAPGGEVYAAGNFAAAGGVRAASIARWNGRSWSALGTGMPSGTVYALAIGPTGDLYAGGSFPQAGGVPVSSVARWDGTAWYPLGQGVDAAVYALAFAPNGDLYAGGNFTGGIARWNGTTWSGLGTGILGQVYALAVVSATQVYAGGNFAQAGGRNTQGVALWNGSSWNSLGAGLGGVVGSFVPVESLLYTPAGQLYAGGNFQTAGGSPAAGFARWNGAAWTALGPANSRGELIALALAPNGDIYGTGFFLPPGTTSLPPGSPGLLDGVGKWNGSAWTTFGTGLHYGNAWSLAVAGNDQFYVGGEFRAVGDDSKVIQHFGAYDLATVTATASPGPAAPGLAVYPNPAHSSVTLRRSGTAGHGPARATLFDARGQAVRHWTFSGPSDVLPVADLALGLYLLRVEADGRLLTQRFVVE